MANVRNEQIDLATGVTNIGNATASLTNTTLNSGCSVETALGWNSAQNFSGRNLSNAGNFTTLTSGATSWSLGVGDIVGLNPIYNSTTSITIVRGFCEANGKFYNLNSNTVHNLTGLVSAFGFQYVYIDDDGSSPPNATFINSLTSPAWNDAKMGWYNGDDRCIGNAVSPSGSSIIMPFVANGTSKEIICITGSNADFIMATDMNPDGTWQTPDVKDGSAVTPVTATAIKVFIGNSNAGARVSHYLSSSEFAALETNVLNGPFISFSQIWNGATPWIELGASRNVKLGGNDDADNSLDLDAKGFRYTR